MLTFSMASLVPSYECHDSTSNYALATSFKICPNSLLTAILPFDMTLNHMERKGFMPAVICSKPDDYEQLIGMDVVVLHRLYGSASVPSQILSRNFTSSHTYLNRDNKLYLEHIHCH